VAATWEAIRAAMAELLRTIPNVQASATILANPTPPTLWVLPGETVYDQAMNRGQDNQGIMVQAIVGTATDQGAQLTLDRFLAPDGIYSVKAVLESERPGPVTLDGLVEDLAVVSCTGYRQYPRPDGSAYLGAEWTVQVWN
jgi:hypothetical protein